MKKKSNYRTPKRLLSLFLSVLLLLSSFVFAAPTVSKAATSITHKPNYSSQKFTFYCTQQKFSQSTTVVNLESSENSYVSREFTAGGKDSIAYAYSVYDFNPNATNYNIPGFYSFYLGNCSSGASTSTSYEYQIFKYMMGQARPNAIVKRVVYGINTKDMIAAYDDAMSTIGTVNTEHYTTNTWNNYINALNTIKRYIDNGGAGYSYNGGNPQRWIYNARQNLLSAINLLAKASVSLGNIFNQVTGATLSGPSKVYVGNEFEVTLKLHEGYTQSVPTLKVTTAGTTKTVTGTKTSANTYTFKVTLPSENYNSITPVNVNKNKYTVTVPSSATGLTIKSPGSYTVTHGDEFSFSVEKNTGYTQKTPSVYYKIGNSSNWVSIGGSESGNTYTYTYNGVTDDLSFRIDGQSVNSYTVSYSTGEGVSKASGTATSINHFGTATIRLDIGEAYSQRTPQPYVSNGTLSSEKRTGNTVEYTLSGVTADTTVTVPNLDLNQYTVTIPSGTGYSLDATSKTVTHGDTTTFTVTLDAAHSQTPPRAFLAGNELSYTKVGENGYKFNTGAVYAHGDVTISNIKINTYSIELPADTDAFKAADKDGFNSTSITHGTDYTFTVTVDKAYTQTTPKVTLKDGTVLTADSAEFVGGNEKGDKVYTYTVKNVTDHNKISVAEMSKNTYSAVLPFDKTEKATYKVTNEKAGSNNVVSGIVYGTDLSFGVELAQQYNRSNVVVKYNGSVLNPVGGVYTISNVTNNIGGENDPQITVEGVDLNRYYITLPLETETGFTIEVGKDADGNLLNAKSVLSGTDFNFKLFLDPAYTDSKPVIKYSADGGDNYKVLTEEDGKYTIENVLSDCIVVVEGVKKNTYTVTFFDANDEVLKKETDVEYGTDLRYEGATPTKASEPVSDETVDGVRTVVEKRYEFIGWSADTSNVTSNMDVYPLFEVKEVTTTYPKDGSEPTVVVVSKTKNIIFISDGLIIHKEAVEKGTDFAGWNTKPVKTSSNPYESFEFLGWDTDNDGAVDVSADETAIENVQADVTFVAVFKSNLPSRTVEFYTFDGSEMLSTTTVKCGSRVVKELYGHNSSPARADNMYEYTFEGWASKPDGDKIDVIDKLVLNEDTTPLRFYAAYSREKIIYTYKFVNDGVVLQEGQYNFVDEGQETNVKFNGETPTRKSTKSTDYTFSGWKTTNAEGKRYDYIYTATYTGSLREYDYALPTSNGTYTIALDEAVGKKIPYNGNLIFTITLDEGYTQTPPVVKSNNETLEYEKSGDNSYVFTIVADGADADEIKAKLTDITVETKINVYDVAINGDSGADISSKGFENTKYNSNGTFTVTLKEGYTQNAPVVTAAEGDRVVITLDKAEGNVYTYTVSEIKSNATITVATKINEYPVVLKNWDGKDVFNGNVKHGEAPVYKTPTKPIDANGQYDFVGWDTDGDGAVDVTTIENVTAPVTAKAVYNYNHRHDSDPADPDSVWELVKTDRANCTKSGMKYYVCKHCGEQTKNVVIPARGHKWTAEGEGWIIVKAPTCTETGLKSRYCCNEANDDYDACNYKEENVVVPATGHHDSDGDYICDDCGFDLGHCSKCICHKGNILSKVLRYICTLLTKIFHKPIKCCKCMDWYNGNISSIS